MEAKAQRNPSVEAMRCFLMFLIVFYHGCNNGPFSDGSGTAIVKLVPWTIFFCTNAFMFISGWYGIKFCWKRVFKFLSMGLFASLVLCLASKPLTGEWHWSISLGWFGNSYLAVMMLAPIVNAGIERLAESRAALLGALSAFAAMLLVSWIPLDCVGLNLHVPGWSGHAFSTMLFIYVAARVLRLIEVEKIISVRIAALIFVLALLIHLARLPLIVIFPTIKDAVVASADYDAPEVLVMGAAFFLLFYRLTFSTWLNNISMRLAPSMFVVYLLHNSTIGRMAYNRLILTMNWQGGGVGQLLAIFCGALVMFVVCVTLDGLRRGLTSVLSIKGTKK